MDNVTSFCCREMFEVSEVFWLFGQMKLRKCLCQILNGCWSIEIHLLYFDTWLEIITLAW